MPIFFSLPFSLILGLVPQFHWNHGLKPHRSFVAFTFHCFLQISAKVNWPRHSRQSAFNRRPPPPSGLSFCLPGHSTSSGSPRLHHCFIYPIQHAFKSSFYHFLAVYFVLFVSPSPFPPLDPLIRPLICFPTDYFPRVFNRKPPSGLRTNGSINQ